MELKEFVKETIVQITQGVKEAQEECFKLGGLVNPMLETPLSNKEKFQIDGKYYPATTVHFVTGLTEGSTKASKGGIGVFFPQVSLGGEVSKGNNNQAVTTVTFSVTVVFPYINMEGKHEPIGGLFY